MDKNVATMAAGYVVDELPQEFVAKFLNQLRIFESEDIYANNKYLNEKDIIRKR